MISRYRLALTVGVFALVGCNDAFNAGPIVYSESPKQTTDLKDKPKLRKAVNDALKDLFGSSPREIKVPPGLAEFLPEHGMHLASRFVPINDPKQPPKPLVYHDSDTGKLVRLEGGYALYRRHCLHCHGVTGDGEGPTAEFLWPRPRDFRPGKYKFTSTTTEKPTRSDLRKTIYQGIPNTAMSSFDGLMTHPEIEQVIDYVIFLSARGQTEINLINNAFLAEESEAEDLFDEDVLNESTKVVFEAWAGAEAAVLNPPIPRVPPTGRSIANGRSLFLGHQATKGLQCVGCHDEKAHGNGTSFVPLAVFQDITFGGDPNRLDERLKTYDKATQDLWTNGSIDDWGNPLRAANLNNGERTVYKGGQRPIDLYRRIAKGINGAKMPAHASVLKPEEIWDLVNFVLALPSHPELLEHVPPPPG
ncbi:MAG: c-type cytochrome, partial [Isosphaeraceae bacterium]